MEARIAKQGSMTKVFVMQTGSTTWDEQKRLEPAAGVPLSEKGVLQVRKVLAELALQNIHSVYAGAGESEWQTGRLAADALGVNLHESNALGEIDFGFWQGLTHQEIRQRQPKRYRQWLKRPAAVGPPNGESLTDAQKRLRTGVARVLKRQKGLTALVVLKPIMVGLLRCTLADAPLDKLWDYVAEDFAWESFELNGKSL